MPKGFAGIVPLNASLYTSCLVKNLSTGLPINADSPPRGRIYGPNGFVQTVNGAPIQSGVVSTAVASAGPITITTAAPHGLVSGCRVTVGSVSGFAGANSDFTITVTGANTFTLNGTNTTGSGTGGTWSLTGVYQAPIPATQANGYANGTSYDILWVYTISGAAHAQLDSFQVA